MPRLHDTAGDMPTGNLGDHRRGAAAGPVDGRGIGHPFEPIRRRARQREPPRRGPDRERRELRRFEQDVGRVGGDLCAGSPHHPGQRHGPLRIGDHAHRIGEGIGLVVDGRERFAWQGPPHDDAAAPNLGEVEGVERLPAFEHHVVGDVDDIVDAGHSHGGQPVDEPLRARPHPHALDHPGRIKRTDLGLEDLHRDVRCRRDGGLLQARIGNVERAGEQHSGLTGHADVPEAVGAVARHLDLDRRVGADYPRRLVIESGEEQPFDEGIGRHGQTHILGQPVRGDNHGLLSPLR